MSPLPRKKVGLVSCSGEEKAEGTVTRLAVLRVLESLRPRETVTICLPLFLAGGEADRAFARFHPTIAIDGCEKQCAAKGTERYSSKPAASLIVTDIVPTPPAGCGSARQLNQAGLEAVTAVATEIARHVDRLLASRKPCGEIETADSGAPNGQHDVVATCSCGSGIPVLELDIAGRRVEALAVPLIFAMFRQAGKAPDPPTTVDLLETASLYNSIPDHERELWRQALELQYAAFFAGESH